MGIFNKIRDFVFPEVEEKIDYKVIADSEKIKKTAKMVEDKTVRVKKISEVEDAAKNPLDIPLKAIEKKEIIKDVGNKRKHIDVEEVTTIKKVNSKVKAKTSISEKSNISENTYQPRIIISPIFGKSEVKDEFIQEQTINKTTPVARKPNDHKNSVIDTIISPIYGTNIKSNVTIDKNEEILVDKKVMPVNNYIKVENKPSSDRVIQSIDDILEVPDKMVLKSSAPSNMTIFDDELKEKK